MQPSKEQIERINELALREIYEDLPDSFINFTNSDVVNFCLHQIKTGLKSEQSARVLNSWINNDIIAVNSEDKGKVKRFDRLESIWLSIVVEGRKFGIPLDSLKRARKELLQSPIPNFSLLKFSVLDTILRKPQALMIFESGYTNIKSLESYSKIVAHASYAPHLNFLLQDYITLEYPNSMLNVDFQIPDVYDDAEKMTMLYFLKTGDFKSIKLYLNDNDIRLIENCTILLQNELLMKSISSWSFHKAEIFVEDDVKVTITP
jgi:hypothetical protein